MIDAETHLMIAARNRLRSQLGIDDHDCDVEFDDEAPAIAGREYYAVIPQSGGIGQPHAKGGTTWDLNVGLRLLFMVRIANIPKDRRRNPFLENLTGLNAKLARAIEQIDFSYDVLNDANTLIAATEGATPGKFYEPLRIASFEKPRTVVRDAYQAAKSTVGGEPVLGLVRAVNFTGARFLRERYIDQES